MSSPSSRLDARAIDTDSSAWTRLVSRDEAVTVVAGALQHTSLLAADADADGGCACCTMRALAAHKRRPAGATQQEQLRQAEAAASVAAAAAAAISQSMHRAIIDQVLANVPLRQRRDSATSSSSSPESESDSDSEADDSDCDDNCDNAIHGDNHLAAHASSSLAASDVAAHPTLPSRSQIYFLPSACAIAPATVAALVRRATALPVSATAAANQPAPGSSRDETSARHAEAPILVLPRDDDQGGDDDSDSGALIAVCPFFALTARGDSFVDAVEALSARAEHVHRRLNVLPSPDPLLMRALMRAGSGAESAPLTSSVINISGAQPASETDRGAGEDNLNHCTADAHACLILARDGDRTRGRVIAYVIQRSETGTVVSGGGGGGGDAYGSSTHSFVTVSASAASGSSSDSAVAAAVIHAHPSIGEALYHVQSEALRATEATANSIEIEAEAEAVVGFAAVRVRVAAAPLARVDASRT
jgi:hypothetical protein